MDYNAIIRQLDKNKEVFKNLLTNIAEEAIIWRPTPESWCLLEIACHLYDEEREDFRTRLRYTLESPGKAPPPFDPLVWVKERKYMEQDFDRVVAELLTERTHSIRWLQSLEYPAWDNAYIHPRLGPLTAHHYICNWLAHDYLHIRQILKNKFHYLQKESKNTLNYAGEW